MEVNWLNGFHIVLEALELRTSPRNRNYGDSTYWRIVTSSVSLCSLSENVAHFELVLLAIEGTIWVQLYEYFYI